MECKNVIKRLSALQDNELSARDRSQISSHLKSCHECKNHFNSIVLLKEQWPKTPQLTSTKSLAAQIMQTIHQMRVNKPFSKMLNFAIYSFILILVFFVVFLFNVQSTSPNNDFNELLSNNSIVSMVIDKEHTSVINISEDIFDSILIKGGENE